MKNPQPERIVILTGAGISADSGVKTFRDNGGLWEDHDVMDVATPEAFARNPELVHRFYNARRAQLSEVEPNAAHAALARLEDVWTARGGQVLVVTQNVDDLHERAGSRNLLHMHGELKRARCGFCSWKGPWAGDLDVNTPCPKCGDTHVLRPHIVWFGEVPLGMRTIESALSRCDLFVSIGTSGAVHPAAGFVQMARTMDKPALELNLEPSAGSALFTDSRYGRAADIVPVWVDELIG